MHYDDYEMNKSRNEYKQVECVTKEQALALVV